MVIEEKEGSSGFRITAGAETTVSEGVDDFRGQPVGNVLHSHQAPSQPKIAVGSLIYLEIGIISFVVPLVVPETVFRFYPVGEAHLQHQGIPDSSPHVALLVCKERTYQAGRAFLHDAVGTSH